MRTESVKGLWREAVLSTGCSRQLDPYCLVPCPEAEWTVPLQTVAWEACEGNVKGASVLPWLVPENKIATDSQNKRLQPNIQSWTLVMGLTCLGIFGLYGLYCLLDKEWPMVTIFVRNRLYSSWSECFCSCKQTLQWSGMKVYKSCSCRWFC